MLTQNPIRSEIQLDYLFNKIVEIKNIFESNNIQYFIGGGSLIGICRTGKLLPWATGSTFHFKESELKKVKKAFDEFNFSGKPGNKKGKAIFKCFVFELIPWYQDGDFVIRRKYRLPADLFSYQSDIKINDTILKTFSNPVKYLEWRYGPDWKTPINSNIRKEFKEQKQYYR